MQMGGGSLLQALVGINIGKGRFQSGSKNTLKMYDFSGLLQYLVNYSSLSAGTGRAMNRVRRGWAGKGMGSKSRKKAFSGETIAFVGLSGGETVEGQSRRLPPLSTLG